VTDATLEVLLAEREIRQQMTNYCRGIDRLDRDLLASVWHDDATCEYEGIFKGTAKDVVAWFMECHLAYAAHSHQVTNQTIKVDGDKAASEAYVTASIRAFPDENGNAVDMWVIGRYLDRWSKRDGRWALDYRYQINDVFSSYQVLGTQDLPDTPEDPAAGLARRNTDDPSYANFASVRETAVA
jgi:hypothetical protein